MKIHSPIKDTCSRMAVYVRSSGHRQTFLSSRIRRLFQSVEHTGEQCRGQFPFGPLGVQWMFAFVITFPLVYSFYSSSQLRWRTAVYRTCKMYNSMSIFDSASCFFGVLSVCFASPYLPASSVPLRIVLGSTLTAIGPILAETKR